MNILLIKKTEKHIHFVQLESQNDFLIIKQGKNEKVTSESTRKCGSEESAKIQLKEISEEYKKRGFVEKSDYPIVLDKIIFDKVSWHLNENFPQSLPRYQAYIHTGFFIGWLLKNGLISDDLKNESEAIRKFNNNEITSVEFYKNQLDGVFTSNDVNDIGLAFTQSYFDFVTGMYLKDYEKTLAKNLPTLFHVRDTYENFISISFIISKRFDSWRKEKII